jgi:hypothetical protein
MPFEDKQLIFLNLVDRFAPTHLQMLSYVANRSGTPRPQGELNNPVVQDLNNQGLLRDTRPFAARNRDYPDLLSSGGWEVSSLGRQFLEFIRSPEVQEA